MTENQLHATIVAATFALLPVIVSAELVSVSRRAVDGRLPPNKTTGIRTPATMSNDRAWVVAHGAALRMTPLLIGVTVIAWIVLFATAWNFPTVIAAMVAGIATAAGVIAALIYVAYVANKAAKTVGDTSEGRLDLNTHTNETPNARYGSVGLRIYAVLNALLLVGVCVFLWLLAARADNHGISPNESLGFRSQSTLASLHGWYVAQRVGFHFAAVAATLIVVAAFALVIVVYVRPRSRAWILLIPALAGLGIGLCMVVAGQRADKAAISVETPKADRPLIDDLSPDCRGQRLDIQYELTESVPQLRI